MVRQLTQAKTASDKPVDGERLEMERTKAENLKKERLEKDRLNKERIEKERLEKETLEKQHIERELRDKECIESGKKQRFEHEPLQELPQVKKPIPVVPQVFSAVERDVARDNAAFKAANPLTTEPVFDRANMFPYKAKIILRPVLE
jgi:hypothetical protein